MLPDDPLEPIYLLYDERMLLHRPIGWVEPATENYPKCTDEIDEDYTMENPQRLVVIYKRLMQLEDRLWQMMPPTDAIFHTLTCQLATRKQILLAHSESYYNRMDELQYYSAWELKDLANHDNYYCPDTFMVARLAAGGLLSCVDAVCDKTHANHSNKALALVRPPGHHACQSQEMGFCFIDSVVVAAKYALRTKRAKRIAILDWDIHDGNGTSEATKDDDNIFRIDLHRYNPQEGFYPYTGAPNEVGFGMARGLNLNVGWTYGGIRNQEYAAAFYELVLPLLVDYNPDLLIISCGLDAAKGDLLGGCELTAPFFHAMTKSTLQAIGPDTPVVCALEGGYAMNVIPDCMEAVTLALLNCPYEYHSSVQGKTAAAATTTTATTVVSSSIRLTSTKTNAGGLEEGSPKRVSCPTTVGRTPRLMEVPRGKHWRKHKKHSCYRVVSISRIQPLPCRKKSHCGIIRETLVLVLLHTRPLNKGPCTGSAFDD
mmetsp:Transcript_11703/g.22429  ORF Transcript_11703/g.22429 Transcript_11703/m.22429 type:complete len:486 (+) Transcript_11703:106-1563(+)